LFNINTMKKKLFFFPILIFVFLNSLLYAQTEAQATSIVVSEVKIDSVSFQSKPAKGKKNLKGYAEIVLNGSLKIRDIQVLEIAGETKLKFPTYVSRQGRVYPQVVIHTKEANETILEAIKNGKISEEVIPLEFEVTKILPYEGKKLEAFASVTFNQAVTVECKIMSGKKDVLWVAWPTRPSSVAGEGWIKQAIILDKELKKEVEKELLKTYNEKVE